MFNHILIPISSEYFSSHTLQRGAQLANVFNSSITVVYIIEEKTLQQLDKMSEAIRTAYEQTETRSTLARDQKSTADSIVFNEAKRIFSPSIPSFEKKVIQGEFSKVVHQEVIKNSIDLVLMGFEKGCLLDYRLLDDPSVPIWVESGQQGKKSILAVCSNIYPNKKIPAYSQQLAKDLGWDLHILYVVDATDSVEVDSQGKRSNKKTKKDLYLNGEKFVSQLQSQGISAEQVQGNLEREILRAARRLKAELVVVGREQKERKIFGIPAQNVKKKLTKKCVYSLLFIN